MKDRTGDTSSMIVACAVMSLCFMCGVGVTLAVIGLIHLIGG